MIARLCIVAFLACAFSCDEIAPKPTSSDSTAAAESWALSAKAIEAKSADGTYLARFEPALGEIPDAEPFAIRFGVRRADGAALASDARFIVDGEMPQHGHGMNMIPTTQRVSESSATEARVLANGLLFHMPGRWVLSLDIEEDGVLERTQWFVDVR